MVPFISITETSTTFLLARVTGSTLYLWMAGYGRGGQGEAAYELFQLQMEFLFPFLRTNNLRSSLLNIRARSFLLSRM